MKMSTVIIETISLFLTFTLFAVHGQHHYIKSDPRADALISRGFQRPYLSIAAFNVRIFGDRKYSDKDVVDTLLQILSRYDITLMQEIRDIDGSSFQGLMTDLNENNPYSEDTFAYNISERLGRGSSKEEYAYVYKSDIVAVTNLYQHQNYEVFERPPFAARVSVPSAEVNDFGLLGLHSRPDDAVAEINGLVPVYDHVSQLWQLQDIIVLGDFNAGCSYVTNGRLDSLDLKTDDRFQWLIGDDVDTTVSNSDCPYDRIVVAGANLQASVVKMTARPFLFMDEYGMTQEKAMDVSDHYPVEVKLYGAISESFKESFGAGLGLRISSRSQADPDELAILKEHYSVTGPDDFVEEVYSVDGQDLHLTLTRSRLTADELIPALDDLHNSFPSALEEEVVAATDAFLVSLRHTTHMPKVHGLPPPAATETNFRIKIMYSLVSPFFYEVLLICPIYV